MSKILDYRALDTRVLVVAVEGEIHDWTAYIGAVNGRSHVEEIESVAAHGTKLPKNLALAMFTSLKSLSWRD